MISEYCRNYSIIPQENKQNIVQQPIKNTNNNSNNNQSFENKYDVTSKNRRALSLSGDISHNTGMNSTQNNNNSLYLQNINQMSNSNQRNHNVKRESDQQIHHTQEDSSKQYGQDQKIRTKAQLDNEIEKLRQKLKSVKRNNNNNNYSDDLQNINNQMQSNTNKQYKENDVPKNITLNQRIELKLKESGHNSGSKSVKSSLNNPKTSILNQNIHHHNNNNNINNSQNNSNNNNKRMFSEEVSDRILHDLRKQTAQKVEDFIENSYYITSTKNSKNTSYIQQQKQYTQQDRDNNNSKDLKYLKLGDITSNTNKIMENSNSFENNINNSNYNNNRSYIQKGMSILQNSSISPNQIRQSLNIQTSSSSYGNQNGIINPTKSNSQTRHSSGGFIPFTTAATSTTNNNNNNNNIFQCGLNTSNQTPQNQSSILNTGHFYHGNNLDGHGAGLCEARKCTNCIKRREKSAEKMDRRKLSENKKQFLNKYNISDTRKEYSSYKEQKVQQRRFSIHTNQIQEPFNFVLPANGDINLNNSGSVRNQNLINSNHSLMFQTQQQQQQQQQQQYQYNENNQQQDDQLDSSWQAKVTTHVKALQQAIADNATTSQTINNSRQIMLNDLNFSTIDPNNNSSNNNNNNNSSGIININNNNISKSFLSDYVNNYKNLNISNTIDSSMISINNRMNNFNSSNPQLNQQINQSANVNNFKNNNQKEQQINNKLYTKNIIETLNQNPDIEINSNQNVQDHQNINSKSNNNNNNNNNNTTDNYQNETQKQVNNEDKQQQQQQIQKKTKQEQVEEDEEKQNNNEMNINEEQSLQQSTISQIVQHYENLLKTKEFQYEEIIYKYETIIQETNQENQSLQEYKEQLMIMNNDLAKELEKKQNIHEQLEEDEKTMRMRFQDEEIKLNQEISNQKQRIEQLDKDKSVMNKAFEYKSIECDVLKEELLKLKSQIQDYSRIIDSQKLTIDEFKFTKQSELELINQRQSEIHKSYKNQFNSFLEKIQQIKVVNDDYLIANKKEFESIEKRFYEDSLLLTKPSCIQSTQGDDIESKNQRLEIENRQLLERIHEKEEEILKYINQLQELREQNINMIDSSRMKEQYENEINKLSETITILKSNETKLIDIINQLESTISNKDNEINYLNSNLHLNQSNNKNNSNNKIEQDNEHKIKSNKNIDEQESYQEKKKLQDTSNYSSIDDSLINSTNRNKDYRSEIQSLIQKNHKLQIQNNTLNEDLIEREKQVNILQYQNQQCQKELEELRCGIQEFETEVEDMKRIYNMSFENEKKSIIEYYEQKLDQQHQSQQQQQQQLQKSKLNTINDTNCDRNQSGTFNNINSKEKFDDIDNYNGNQLQQQQQHQQQQQQSLLNVQSDPTIITEFKKQLSSSSNQQIVGLPPTHHSKKNLIHPQNFSFLQKQESNLALNKKHIETFEETFEDGRLNSQLKLSNITFNQTPQQQQNKPHCTFEEYMNKYTNNNGETNSDAFKKEIFQLKEQELLQEIDNLNKKYYLQEQNTVLEISWIKQQNESAIDFEQVQYKEQLDSLEKQIDQLKCIKQQLKAVNEEIETRFEGNVSSEYALELKQKQIEIQINQKEITHKLEQYASINEELQMEFSKNIQNLSQINDDHEHKNNHSTSHHNNINLNQHSNNQNHLE